MPDHAPDHDPQRAQDDLYHLFEDVRNYAAPISLERRDCNLAEVWRTTWANLEGHRSGRETTLREERDGVDLQKIIERAKGLLMKNARLDEEGAFLRLQKLARDRNQKLVEVAQMLLGAEGASPPPNHAADRGS